MGFTLFKVFRSKYNASTINYLLVFFLRFDLKTKQKKQKKQQKKKKKKKKKEEEKEGDEVVVDGLSL